MTQQRVSPISVTSVLPAVPVLSLQAALGQSANLFEVKNNAGTILSSVSRDGTLYIRSVNSQNLVTFFNGTSGYGAGNIASNGIFNINGANFGFPYTASGAVVSINAASTTSIPLTARGVASQTADLQQWL